MTNQEAIIELKDLKDYCRNTFMIRTYEAYTQAINKGIKSLENQKIGHWIAQDIHNCHTNFKCSKCGYIHSFTHLYGKPTADYTYCPYCGAKMIKSQKSEDNNETD